MGDEELELREEIKKKIELIFSLREKRRRFVPGKTWVQYAGGVFDDKEINASVSSLLDGWFGLGKKAEEMENLLAQFLGVKGTILTNSGSSANLLAIASLRSSLFPNSLKEGDEIITSACGFPTTVNPIILYRMVPVFLDIDRETYNLNASDLEKAFSPRTRAVFIAHTMGNPNEMDKITDFCRERNLFLVEDNCDALGSSYGGRRTGSFGLLSSQSFYPPHHLTMGEGGAINYNDSRLERIVRSLRDWGRSCWCRGDEKRMHGACGVRFNYRVGGKPYDHKYITHQIGFNLKPIEPQAAMGVEQVKRLPAFIKKRDENFRRLYRYAKAWEDYFILPKSLPQADPCWFAFIVTIRDGAPFTRQEITLFLEEKMIQTRPLFAGNITRQPAYRDISYRKIGDLGNSDLVLHNAFFLGIYPGLGPVEIDYIAESVGEFLKENG